MKINKVIYEDEKRRLICLIPKDGESGITCHEKTLCDCEILELLDYMEEQNKKLQKWADNVLVYLFPDESVQAQEIREELFLMLGDR